MKVLITGGAGFVGRHFARRLVNDGNDVLLVDDLSTGLPLEQWAFKPKKWVPSELGTLRLCIGSVRDWLDFAHAFPDGKPTPDHFDLIIHCAAIVGGRLKIEGDPLAVATDLAIDADFFHWCAQSKHKKTQIIYFSSSAVYPLELQTRAKYMKLNEHLLTFNTSRVSMPDMSYGWSKLSGEYLAKFAVEKYGLDVKIFRPFGGYGEDQSWDYPFPSIIRRVLVGENPVTVWGSGDQKRDFIHIDDVVEGVLATKDLMAPGSVLNLGTGRATSFKELANMACDILKMPAKVLNDDTKPEGVFYRVCDNFNFHQLYEPKVTLEQGILRAGLHLQKVLDGAKVSV
jgi:nucleoside-diphosphate-sugar epimerase